MASVRVLLITFPMVSTSRPFMPMVFHTKPNGICLKFWAFPKFRPAYIWELCKFTSGISPDMAQTFTPVWAFWNAVHALKLHNNMQLNSLILQNFNIFRKYNGNSKNRYQKQSTYRAYSESKMVVVVYYNSDGIVGNQASQELQKQWMELIIQNWVRASVSIPNYVYFQTRICKC